MKLKFNPAEKIKASAGERIFRKAGPQISASPTNLSGVQLGNLVSIETIFVCGEILRLPKRTLRLPQGGRGENLQLKNQ